MITLAALASAHAQSASFEYVGPAAPSGTLPVTARPIGRVEAAPNGMYRYQWPGVSFVASYQGSIFYFTTGNGDQDLHITLDRQPLPPLVRRPAGVYRIQSPAAGPHTVRIDTVNENQDSPRSLGSFAVDAAGHGLPPAAPTRQIEMIGDSHTVGYGNTSASRECSTDQVWNTTDTSQSIGADLAQNFGADLQINAISGRGVVRNYNGFAADTLPVAYPYLLFDKSNLYHDPQWQPAVIVVSLGTNDFSTALHAEERWKTRDALHADFETTYVAFLERLRQQNPAALIVLWATDMAGGEIEAEGTRVVRLRNNAGDTRTLFVPMDGLAFTGCHSHPSITDDWTVANRLIPVINAHHPEW